MSRPTILLLLVAFVCSACEPVPEQTADETVADIVEFTISGRDTAVVRLLWTSTDLARPNALVFVQDTLVVGDRTRLHILTAGGEHIATVGRRGEGPQEFQSIAGLGIESGKVVVLDSRNARYSTLSLDGRFLKTQPIRWPPDFANPIRTPEILRAAGGGMLRLATGSVPVGGPRRLGLLWESLESDSALVVQAWDDVEFANAGDIMAPKAAYGPKAIVAVAPDGGYAYGSGLTHCYERFSLRGESEGRFCGPREPLPIGPGARQSTRDDIPESLPPQAIDALSSIMQMQELGTEYPVYDHLAVGEGDDIWMRLISEFQPDVHPVLVDCN